MIKSTQNIWKSDQNGKTKLWLRCTACGRKDHFDNENQAFLEGWDFPPMISIDFVTCPDCPSAQILLSKSLPGEE